MGMRVLQYSDLEQRAVEGVKGTLTALDVIGEDHFGVGLRVVPPQATVPKPGAPFARGRRVLFVLRGSGILSNGEYYEKVAPGNFVTLDDGETPTFSTKEEELVFLEVRQHGAGTLSPPAISIAVPMPVDARAMRTTVQYDQVD